MSTPPVPNVESLLAELARDRGAVDQPGDAAARAQEEDLHELLAEANRCCVIALPPRGWKRALLRPFGGLLAQINRSNAAVVRTLNRLVRLLQGEDLPEVSALCEAQQRRIHLLEHLSDRVAALEAQQLDARLAKLEAERETPGP